MYPYEVYFIIVFPRLFFALFCVVFLLLEEIEAWRSSVTYSRSHSNYGNDGIEMH